MAQKFAWARQAEILRSDEKDRQHLDSTRRDIFDALIELIGLRRIVRHHQVITTVNSLIYYGLTTLRERQTLGEQYVNIVRCTPETQPNSFFQRAILLADHLPWKQLVKTGNPEQQLVASIFLQLHLIHFYLFGEYSSIARRLGRSRYALLRGFPDMPQLQWTFKIIGILYTIKLLRELFQATISFKSVKTEVKAAKTEENDKEIGGLQCGLCRDLTTECTVTRCGHIFCWTCITEWAVNRPQCPLCRSTVNPEQLVRVINR
ncbi:peroxisome biogenesis factor 10-like [Varroa destructor]|uniref:RING-type E3 ubiquitin transferase n=1 Tax=Varroa destructor TaxID=109461 RepID=A0A7M7JAM3_VARDE|nr:peroxisome biogenesis factor 10-like [Varroa destructor]